MSIGKKIKRERDKIKPRLIDAVLRVNPKWKKEQIQNWSRKRLLANCHPLDRVDFEKEMNLRSQFDNKW